VTDVPERLSSALADRYAIERELGQGGMATVYLATDLRHQRSVALKVLRPELATALGPERFVREIETTARLTHPHILPLLDSGEAGGMLYYTMPYVEGESLRDRLTREPQLPVEEALQIAREVADALHHAHSHAVIHRDIKPENILLESGHAVVSDFGIAKAVAVAGGEKLTETGLAVGTPAYMSPEQAEGAELDGRSDQYGLASVLYEMLAGEPPFTGLSAHAVLAKRLSTPAPRVRVLRETAPPAVEEALLKALSRSPADRFPTCAAFAASLAAAPATAAPGGGRRLLAAAGAVAVVAIAAWVGALLVRSGARPPSATGYRPFTIVAEFDGTAPADVLSAARNLVTAALDESEVIASLPPEQVRLGLALAGKPSGTPLDVTTARELAVRGSVRTVVAGTVDQVGRTYHAALRVIDADSEAVVAAEREVAQGEDDLIPTVDRIVRALRRDLGERRAAIASGRPLERAATPSFAAYQSYRRARELQTGPGDYSAAEAEYRRALALDPGFAWAWRGLATIHVNRLMRDSALAAVDRALAQNDRVSEGQRLELEGFRARTLGELDAALALQERAQRLNRGVPWLLAVALYEVGRRADAMTLIEEWERASPFGLGAPQQASVVRWSLALGRLDDARRRAGPISGLWGDWARMQVAAWTAEWATADSLAARLLEQPDTIFRDGPYRVRAAVAAARGRVRDALGFLGRCATCRPDELALRVVSGSPVSPPPAGRLPSDTAPVGRLRTALWAVAAGDAAAARGILAEVRALAPEPSRRTGVLAALVEAWIAAAAGRHQEVVGLLRPLVDEDVPSSPGVNQPLRWSLAAAYERVGMLDSAAAQLEALATWRRAWGSDQERRGLTHAFAHQRLVVLYARMGRVSNARRHWRAFSETFTAPDPELRRLVTEARTALGSAERRGG